MIGNVIWDNEQGHETNRGLHKVLFSKVHLPPLDRSQTANFLLNLSTTALLLNRTWGEANVRRWEVINPTTKQMSKVLKLMSLTNWNENTC